MRDYYRMLGLLAPYRSRAATLAVCILFSAVLSSVGITFISPLLRIMIYEQPAPAEPAQTEVNSSTAKRASTSRGLAAERDALPLPEGVASARHSAQRWLEERLYRGTRQEMLVRVCVAIFVLYLLKNLFGFAAAALNAQLEQRAIFDIRRAIYGSIQAQPLGFFSKERTGYLVSRVIVDVDMMRGSIAGCATDILANGVMILIGLALVFSWSWQLALATFVIVPPNVVLVGLISKRLHRGSHRTQEEMGALAAVLAETISGIRVVKGFNAEEIEAERYGARNWNYYRTYVKVKLIEALSSPVSEVLGVTTAVFILGFGGHLVFTGRLRADLLFTFLGVMLWIIGPVKKLIKVNATLQQSLAAARRVFGVLDSTPEPGRGVGRTDLSEVESDLSFEGVSFEYRDDAPVLREIDLRIDAGSTVAVVGASGAGKSTLVDLVPRFHAPSSGRICLGGVPLEEIELRALRASIGIVSQEVILFHDTVANNIAYGMPGASRDRIEAAARAANAHEFIASMLQGYDTTVGERGTQISGGQRQRIAIARAILKDPAILIFDEATSALDTESERLVQGAMSRLMEGRTTLVIAHRLSTVVNADEIVLLDRGRIVQRGRHDELMADRGPYRRLYELQFHGAAAHAGRAS